ncbi:hypothetical protein K503DRAFT_855684 [Rhizopogon vinicolor AM-OR11-026]|uniref:YCII-related domain-containing protein n=1 Tax=Rhizopogon vinicolor AM-OR11-026 TaxID=1314800 RepID=A0A1B7N536_9AGAM|nr:hypothetical protein K503DRAFT_855684 [Rhizopogon vinicolor AM-OR11-026]
MLPQSDLSASSTSVKMHPYMLWVPDHIDEGALARRLAVRQQHIVGVNKTAKQGVLKAAGALLAPGSEGAEPQDRKFAGSMLIYEAESLEDARRLAEADVYWKGNVWDKEKMVILPLLMATIFPERAGIVYPTPDDEN